AQEVFEKDCLIHLGTSIAPAGQGKEGKTCVHVRIIKNNGETLEAKVNFGDIQCLPLPVGEKAKAVITPERGFDVGAGSGKTVEAEVEGGLSGVIIDARGRPLVLPEDDNTRRQQLNKWAKQLNAYPD
ncbi:MAG: methylaspartate mutase, partial [candidate division WOR-3 bacterium]